MEKLLGENCTVRVEVESDPPSILIVFDRKAEVHLVHYQDAFQLSWLLKQVVEEVKAEFPSCVVLDVPRIKREQAQISLNQHKDLVALCVDWTDRVRYMSLEAVALLCQAINLKAQDAYYERRGTKFIYDGQGLLRKIINFKYGDEQIVR